MRYFIYNSEFERNIKKNTLYGLCISFKMELNVLYFKFCTCIQRVQVKKLWSCTSLCGNFIFSINKGRGQNNSEFIYGRGWRSSVRMLYLVYCTHTKLQSALIEPCVYCYR